MISLLESQLARLKKQREVSARTDGVGETTSPTTAAAVPPRVEPATSHEQRALVRPDNPQADAELAALLARLTPGDEPDRPAGVAR